MKFKLSYTIILLSILLILSCREKRKIINDEAVLVEHDTTPHAMDLGAFPTPNIPDDNKLTVQGVLLGRMLFHDNLLSRTRTQACANCHNQSTGFSDTARYSIGVKGLFGKRNSMSITNMAWNTNNFFWDGRANLLRDQVVMPIEDHLEMDESLVNVVAKLESKQSYKDQFKRAFGNSEISAKKIALALEQFINSIVSNNSKYDQYLAQKILLSPSEERGRVLFFQEYNQFFPNNSGADCAHCHGGFNFENDMYVNNGLDSNASITDIGREAATYDPNDKAKFKIPTLRNIELTAPYMHDGRFKNLEEVVDHYNSGIRNSSTLDPALDNTRYTGLRLTLSQKTDLVNFLKTLTDESLKTNTKYTSPF